MRRLLLVAFYTLVPTVVMGALMVGVFAFVGEGYDWGFIRLMTGFTALVGLMTGAAEASLP
jgi:hypothetical protein